MTRSQGFQALQGPAWGHHLLDARGLCFLDPSSFLTY